MMGSTFWDGKPEDGSEVRGVCSCGFKSKWFKKNGTAENHLDVHLYEEVVGDEPHNGELEWREPIVREPVEQPKSGRGA